jgi:hypothetical protein
MWERRYSSVILDLGKRLRCGQLHAPAALPRGKGNRYPLDRWLDLEAMEKRKFLLLPRIEPRPFGP